MKAAEFAGESTGGAVLWIHGPQPGLNNEMYIVAPYAAKPKFFELAADDCWTSANEQFRNHREIGPFTAITRSSTIEADLKDFLLGWQPRATRLAVRLCKQDNARGCSMLSGAAADQLLTLSNY